MKLTSPAFRHMSDIPKKYTCQGEDISPPLRIADVPKNARSLVLIMEDPDVPKYIREDGMWDHWIVFNIPPQTTEIPEAENPPGTPGRNTRGTNKYQGPCPPDRKHRYFFKLFALDVMLSLKEGSTKKEVESAMQGHILAQAELIGLYEKR